MNIEGLDYNTQREKLVLPEYGREVQSMVDYAVALPTKAERQSCANAIIAIMRRMFSQSADAEGFERKLWDHLAMMSNFKLDIDYPFDVTEAQTILSKPEPMTYPMNNIPVRHYGAMLFEIFEKLKHMEPGKERDELVKLTANQMHRNLMQWSHGSCDEQKVAADLARFTDGKIKLDLKHFVFEKVKETPARSNNNNNKKKK